MERIPILRMGRYLLVTVQVDMHDKLALTLQDDLTSRIVQTQAKGVLLDISSLDIVDSFIGRMISNIAAMARILDAQTVVVGMQPAVAITLVELGLSLPGVYTALNVEKGMSLLMDLTSDSTAGLDDEAKSTGAAVRGKPFLTTGEERARPPPQAFSAA